MMNKPANQLVIPIRRRTERNLANVFRLCSKHIRSGNEIASLLTTIPNIVRSFAVLRRLRITSFYLVINRA